MMWQDDYRKKCVSAEAAIKKLQGMRRIVVGHACSEPTTLIDALIAQKTLFHALEIVHMVAMGKSAYTEPGMEKYFRHNALFVGGSTRAAVQANRADYTPCFFYEVPQLFREGQLPVDAALIQVSKPDDHGYCSFGLSNDYTKPAAEAAEVVIAEVNDQMPRTFGDNFIHVSELDCIVETSVPLLQMPRAAIGDAERAIGGYCSELIENGSTLQLGIGGIPDAVLLSLTDKSGLGIHSEMFSDGVVDLYEAGVITNQNKTLHKGQMVVTFVMGTDRLYRFINDNPMVAFYPVDYVNHPAVIAKNHKMVSINSCIEVDLMGQVSSESIGYKQFSGTGGQVDYVRGTRMAKGGKSIIAMPSTAKRGTMSRIVPLLKEGSAVTTSRNDVHFIVTEYGIADLRGKTLKARAKALIDIAHPRFRSELAEMVERRFKPQ
ncbi:acetyl-CoA hydrolase/transferase family protein [Fusibacter paucivorans]|uniref:Acetyl-CoA hydrolase/transferase family protein n=1 Tax=Fusibacter paucivorans TaxID=76009 RepID=A0ABS5PNJ3_9FIRM|nr:acetyl-CoA hydrolase/transferase C-terminal domain-containing protein [Fusibacter paucivorans]MBS7525921.1 acetyl-CoA hydrolase/transferase family protein [Fusibacter paucivorans]